MRSPSSPTAACASTGRPSRTPPQPPPTTSKRKTARRKRGFFFVAYTKDDVADKANRPLSFVYNGGAGYASSYTPMGLGPRRAQLTDDGFGMPAPGIVKSSGHTAADGSYEFHKIPPGRYVLMLNPDGPSKEWPFDMQYFPASIRRETAHVFDLGLVNTSPESISTRIDWRKVAMIR